MANAPKLHRGTWFKRNYGIRKGESVWGARIRGTVETVRPGDVAEIASQDGTVRRVRITRLLGKRTVDGETLPGADYPDKHGKTGDRICLCLWDAISSNEEPGDGPDDAATPDVAAMVADGVAAALKALGITIPAAPAAAPEPKPKRKPKRKARKADAAE